MKLLIGMVLAVVAVLPCAAQDDAQPSVATQKMASHAALAPTPPMGWNTWNKFGCNISEALIRSTADEMVSSGMRDAGYVYLVIDDCWHGERDAHGDVQPDAKRFPSGIKALADYVHSKGLKFGIYSDAGTKTCAGRTGSRGHEFQDAKQYAAWGVDYLKFDWCNTSTQDAKASYTLMRQALDDSGRPIVFSMCEWGTAKPWLWASDVGNLWRTTGDIYDKWEGKERYQLGMMNIVDLQVGLESFAGPGHWNDPDMLEIGNGGMTADEYRTHMSLWSLLAAPLIAGNDLRNMTDETKSILMNADVISIDQDTAAKPVQLLTQEEKVEILDRPLHDGSVAVGLFNRGDTPASGSFAWDSLKLPVKKFKVMDLWKHEPVTPSSGSFTATIPAHGVVLLKVSAADTK